jgi:hypothetical protein
MEKLIDMNTRLPDLSSVRRKRAGADEFLEQHFRLAGNFSDFVIFVYCLVTSPTGRPA